MDLALNNLQRLICHKTKQTKPNLLSYQQYYMTCIRNPRRKHLVGKTRICQLFWIDPERRSCMVTYLPSHNPFKLVEWDMLGTGEILAEQQKTYDHQFSAYSRWRLEDLWKAMVDTDGWRETRKSLLLTSLYLPNPTATNRKRHPVSF